MRPWFLATLAGVALACRPAPPPLTEADKTAIRAVTDSFVANARARRDSANALLFTEDATFMPPNDGPVEGRAAIRAWLAAFPPMSEFTVTAVEIDGRGDLAYVRGTYALTIAAASGRPAMPDHGKFLEVRRRQPDGRWLVHIDIFNSDVPLAAP